MKRKKVIVFAGGWGGEYLQETVSGLSEAASVEDTDIYTFINFTVHSNDSETNIADINFFKLPDIGRFDGAVLLANSFNSKEELDYLISEIKSLSIPCLTVEYEIPGFSSISTDNFSGMYDLVSHVIKIHNAHTLLFIGGPKNHPESQERLNAFKNACKDNDINIDDNFIRYGDWSKVAIPPILDEWLTDHELPDAIIAANDIMALSVCDYLREKNIRIPDDIIVTGFDCINEAQIYIPSISSVNHEWNSMGSLTFNQLSKLMKGESILPKIVQKTCFFPSDSCGCFNSGGQNRINGEVLKRGLITHQMDALSIDSHFRHFYNAVRKINNKLELHFSLSYLFSHTHIIEGNEFELYLDPEFFNITDDNSNLKKQGHCDLYDRICSLKGNESLPLAEVSKEEALFSAPSKSDTSGYYIFVPLHSEGYTFGFAVMNGPLNAASENQYYIWTRHMIQALEQVRSNITISKLYEKTRILSETDPLTGVYNRCGCQEKAYPQMIENTKNGGCSLIMLVDVDRMKSINDLYGHSSGDLALIAVTTVLKNTLPEAFNICRFGGDEFLIAGCLENADENIDLLVERIEKKISEYSKENEYKFPLTVSIGYTKLSPNSISDIEKGIVTSDENMYDLKKLHHQRQ